jgi:hypothetical protein
LARAQSREVSGSRRIISLCAAYASRPSGCREERVL